MSFRGVFMDYRRLASTFELRSRYEANRREAHLREAPLTHASHTWHARSVRFGVDAAVVVNPLLQLTTPSPEFSSAGLSCFYLSRSTEWNIYKQNLL